MAGVEGACRDWEDSTLSRSSPAGGAVSRPWSRHSLACDDRAPNAHHGKAPLEICCSVLPIDFPEVGRRESMPCEDGRWVGPEFAWRRLWRYSLLAGERPWIRQRHQPRCTEVCKHPPLRGEGNRAAAQGRGEREDRAL